MSGFSVFFNFLKDKIEFNEQYQIFSGLIRRHEPALSRIELYTKWLDAYLPCAGIQVNPGSPFGELRGVYQLVEQLDGYYVRQDELKHLLHQCRVLTATQQEQLVEAIVGFLRLIEQTELNPERLVEEQRLEDWWTLFPEGQAWRVLEWLRS
ncbi:MAG: hypothetical protein QF614_01960, partial [SAR324 cluster bacterium]|nr:hypothetical protein [SAR324 cluster bacterium]